MYNTKTIDLSIDFENGVKQASNYIKKDELVAFPTETVYGLGANAFSGDAVAKIFKAKGRPQDNPLIVHVDSIEMASKLAYINDDARKILEEFWPGPFTAVLKKKDIVPAGVTAGLDSVGIRMPSSDAMLEVIKRTRCPIAAPSANKSGSPSPTEAYHVENDLVGRLPLILDGGSCKYGVESTVCDLTTHIPLVLRPGAITVEQIKELTGSVEVSPNILTPLLSNEKPTSPGMKYKHYAPHADVFVIKGEKKSLVAKTNEMYDEDIANGDKPVIFCFKKDVAYFGSRNVMIQGGNDNINEVAKYLFKNLRDIDNLGYTKVYFESLPTTGMGLAVMNRIIRAAGFKLILVK